MFYRWILALSLLFFLEVRVVCTAEESRLPTADTIISNLRFSSAATVGDEADEYSLVISRGNQILTSTKTETGHHRDITLTLTAFKETFVLDLKLNTYLLASNYIEKAITNSGEIYNDVNHVTSHCYYTGEVRSRSQSKAAVSTCRGITGYFAIGNVSYHIEPKGDELYGPHRVTRSRDEDVKSIFRCGTDRKLKWMSSIDSTSSSGRSIHRMKRSFLYPQDEDRVDKIVELYVANDRSQYLARSSDVNNVYRRAKDIVNFASLDYQPLGIYLVLVGVEVWTDSDKFRILDSNVSQALSSWYAYRTNFINPFHYNDNAALINNVPFYSGVIGKAIVGSMCSNQFSGSMISDLSSQAAVAGATLAHEMGHNFGLQHDDQFAGCTCDDAYASNRCIMFSSSNANRPSTKWSSCSRTQFATSFSQGLDICLYNIPQTIFQPSSKCGNGIVEDGEQCDCGNAPISECNPTCCNNATCQLISTSACASGRCCDVSRCQVKSWGTECRSKSNDCDLSESCNGVDARCPVDSYKPDGTDCTNIDSAYCYQGQCRSHQSQCQLLWGSGASVSNNLCYSNFNDDGAHYGNCGLRWANASVTYIACAAKDVLCGKLLCQQNSTRLVYYQNYFLLSLASIGPYTCRSVIFDFGINTQDPGLVPNGAKCGDKQMCVNQKCIPIPITPPTTTTTTTTSTTTPTTTTSTTRSTSSSTTTVTSTTTSTSTTTTTTTGTPTTTTSTSASTSTTTTSTPSSTSSSSSSTTTSTPTSTTTSTPTSTTTSMPTSTTTSTPTSTTTSMPTSTTSTPTSTTTSTPTSTTTSTPTSTTTSTPTSTTTSTHTSTTTSTPTSTTTTSTPSSTSSSSSSSSPLTTTKSTTKSSSSPTKWTFPPTESTYGSTSEYNGTSSVSPYRPTGPDIGLIVGLTVGLFFGLLILILLIVLGYRYRRNMCNVFHKKLRFEPRQPNPISEVGPNAAPDQNTLHDNHGYISNERTSYDVLNPSRRAPGPPNAAFAFMIPHMQQTKHNSVYSNFSECSTDQPWFSDDPEPAPTFAIYNNQNETSIYNNRNEVFNRTHPAVVALNLAPQPPPKPQSQANSDTTTNGHVFRNNKLPQTPVKPPIIAQSKGTTLLPPPKPQNLKQNPTPRQPFLPTPPAKPNGKVTNGKPAIAMKPPIVAKPQDIPPKPKALPKPPIKPTNAGGNGVIESGQEPISLSVLELMHQFGESSRKPIVSPTRPIPAKRVVPQVSNV